MNSQNTPQKRLGAAPIARAFVAAQTITHYPGAAQLPGFVVSAQMLVAK
jgi:hypothetical protein